jgi:16S rRNA (cytosine1402-N4)-methyltransferase
LGELPYTEPVSDRPHLPVLPEQVSEHLAQPTAKRFLDGTVGAGGHSRLILEALPEAQLVALDRDPGSLALARETLAPFGERVRLIRSAFADAPETASEHGPFDGILLDLGISSMQVDQPERGFSFKSDGPLDMRMDPDGETTARDLVEQLGEEDLANVIFELGEERHSRRIARAIVAARREGPIATTSQLADIVRRAMPHRGGKSKNKVKRRRRPIDPATRTFQALRLAVNDELGQLDRALPGMWSLLAPGGRLAVISFHSLEDRRVKLFFKSLKSEGVALVLTKKPLVADDDEVAGNPRARSAKLRVAERL